MEQDSDKEKSNQKLKEELRKLREPDPEVLRRAHEEWERMERMDPRLVYPYMSKRDFEQMMIERNK